MKKLTALFLALLMLFSMTMVYAESSSAPAWEEYDKLIAEIKSTTDFEARKALMHKAEDMLMETGALMPLYYYVDEFMAKPDFKDYYTNLYGMKHFEYATNGDKNFAKLNLSSEPDKLDPALNSSVDGGCLAIASFGGLYTHDKEGKLVPNYSTGYTVSDDGLTYTLTMREGLKWSDDTPLTAKDFEYSWKRAAATETGADYSYMFDIIKGYPDNLAVSASEDGKTLTMELSAPCAYMEDLFAFPVYYAVPQHAVEAAEGYKENPGAWATAPGYPVSGPYKLVEWNHDVNMVYEKNPNYWDAENVKLEKLEFMLTADTITSYAAYEAGDLDFIESVPTDELEKAKASGEHYVVNQLGTYYVVFNVKSPLFAGKTAEQASKMRKALSLLVDREYIVENIGKMGQIPANSFIPAKMANGAGGEFKANDDAYTYPVAEETGYYSTKFDESTNIPAAIELLKEAGFEFGEDNKLSPNTPLSFEYLTNTHTAHEAIAQTIQQDFAAIGIEMTIKSIDWKVFLNERKQGNYDVARSGWIADFNDPINMLEMWTTDSGNNDAQFGR